MSSSSQPSTQLKSSGLLSVFIVVAALYLAREVLILLALAILLAFLLEPLANRFERIHLGRVGSALAAVAIAVLLAGALTHLVIGQLGNLGDKLPEYEKTLHEKLRGVELEGGGVFGH